MEKLDSNKKRKINQAINFLEEISWILDSKKIVDLKEAPSLLRNLLESGQSSSLNDSSASNDSNKSYLVGTLPSLFLDTEIFKTNFDLADFAKDILNMPVSRPEKRSKYELIGLIICEVANLNESSLTSLTQALSKLTDNGDRIKLIRDAKKSADFSWNDTIKFLSTL